MKRFNWISPVWLLLIAIVSLQFGAASAKSIFDELDPLAMAWLRMLISTPILLAIARPRLRQRSRAEWRDVLCYGLILGVMNFAIYQAMARIPIGIAVTIEFLGPLAIAFAGIRKLRDVVWVLLAGVGVVLLGWSPTESLDWAGVGFALLAACCWAGYIMISVRVGRAWSGISGVAVGSIVGAVLFAGPGIAAAGPAVLDWRILGMAALVAVCSSAIPYALEMIALRSLRPSVFGIMQSLEPAMAALMALLLLNEALTPPEWLAIACVVAASAGAAWSQELRTPPAAG
ncbi:MAG: EamA family transporter [Propionibacteriaceae bacterium]|jgi:inner membrane transporter RhtA|nr:EamA family transporter [Propionibacteriaceae bacterium]